MTGLLEVLNVGNGDTKIQFDKDNPKDVAKARTIIKDMLTRGYALFVEVNGEHVRVKRFDPETCEYIVQLPEPEKKKDRRKGYKGNRLPALKSKSVAIGRSAGG